MWEFVDRGSMVSLRPQTRPRPTSGAWFDFKTTFENLNLVLDKPMTSFTAEMFISIHKIHVFTIGKILKLVWHDLLHRICQ